MPKANAQHNVKLEALEPRLLMAADWAQAMDQQLKQYDQAATWNQVSAVSAYFTQQQTALEQGIATGLSGGLSLKNLLLRSEQATQLQTLITTQLAQAVNLVRGHLSQLNTQYDDLSAFATALNQQFQSAPNQSLGTAWLGTLQAQVDPQAADVLKLSLDLSKSLDSLNLNLDLDPRLGSVAAQGLQGKALVQVDLQVGGDLQQPTFTLDPSSVQVQVGAELQQDDLNQVLNLGALNLREVADAAQQQADLSFAAYVGTSGLQVDYTAELEFEIDNSSGAMPAFDQNLLVTRNQAGTWDFSSVSFVSPGLDLSSMTLSDFEALDLHAVLQSLDTEAQTWSTHSQTLLNHALQSLSLRTPPATLLSLGQALQSTVAQCMVQPPASLQQLQQQLQTALSAQNASVLLSVVNADTLRFSFSLSHSDQVSNALWDQSASLCGQVDLDWTENLQFTLDIDLTQPTQPATLQLQALDFVATAAPQLLEVTYGSLNLQATPNANTFQWQSSWDLANQCPVSSLEYSDPQQPVVYNVSLGQQPVGTLGFDASMVPQLQLNPSSLHADFEHIAASDMLTLLLQQIDTLSQQSVWSQTDTLFTQHRLDHLLPLLSLARQQIDQIAQQSPTSLDSLQSLLNQIDPNVSLTPDYAQGFVDLNLNLQVSSASALPLSLNALLPAVLAQNTSVSLNAQGTLTLQGRYQMSQNNLTLVAQSQNQPVLALEGAVKLVASSVALNLYGAQVSGDLGLVLRVQGDSTSTATLSGSLGGNFSTQSGGTTCFSLGLWDTNAATPSTSVATLAELNAYYTVGTVPACGEFSTWSLDLRTDSSGDSTRAQHTLVLDVEPLVSGLPTGSVADALNALSSSSIQLDAITNSQNDSLTLLELIQMDSSLGNRPLDQIQASATAIQSSIKSFADSWFMQQTPNQAISAVLPNLITYLNSQSQNIWQVLPSEIRALYSSMDLVFSLDSQSPEVLLADLVLKHQLDSEIFLDLDLNLLKNLKLDSLLPSLNLSLALDMGFALTASNKWEVNTQNAHMSKIEVRFDWDQTIQPLTFQMGMFQLSTLGNSSLNYCFSMGWSNNQWSHAPTAIQANLSLNGTVATSSQTTQSLFSSPATLNYNTTQKAFVFQVPSLNTQDIMGLASVQSGDLVNQLYAYSQWLETVGKSVMSATDLGMTKGSVSQVIALGQLIEQKLLSVNAQGANALVDSSLQPTFSTFAELEAKLQALLGGSGVHVLFTMDAVTSIPQAMQVALSLQMASSKVATLDLNQLLSQHAALLDVDSSAQIVVSADGTLQFTLQVDFSGSDVLTTSHKLSDLTKVKEQRLDLTDDLVNVPIYDLQQVATRRGVLAGDARFTVALGKTSPSIQNVNLQRYSSFRTSWNDGYLRNTPVTGATIEVNRVYTLKSGYTFKGELTGNLALTLQNAQGASTLWNVNQSDASNVASLSDLAALLQSRLQTLMHSSHFTVELTPDQQNLSITLGGDYRILDDERIEQNTEASVSQLAADLSSLTFVTSVHHVTEQNQDFFEIQVDEELYRVLYNTDPSFSGWQAHNTHCTSSNTSLDDLRVDLAAQLQNVEVSLFSDSQLALFADQTMTFAAQSAPGSFSELKLPEESQYRALVSSGLSLSSLGSLGSAPVNLTINNSATPIILTMPQQVSLWEDLVNHLSEQLKDQDVHVTALPALAGQSARRLMFWGESDSIQNLSVSGGQSLGFTAHTTCKYMALTGSLGASGRLSQNLNLSFEVNGTTHNASLTPAQTSSFFDLSVLQNALQTQLESVSAGLFEVGVSEQGSLYLRQKNTGVNITQLQLNSATLTSTQNDLRITYRDSSSNEHTVDLNLEHASNLGDLTLQDIIDLVGTQSGQALSLSLEDGDHFKLSALAGNTLVQINSLYGCRAAELLGLNVSIDEQGATEIEGKSLGSKAVEDRISFDFSQSGDGLNLELSFALHQDLTVSSVDQSQHRLTLTSATSSYQEADFLGKYVQINNLYYAITQVDVQSSYTVLTLAAQDLVNQRDTDWSTFTPQSSFKLVSQISTRVGSLGLLGLAQGSVKASMALAIEDGATRTFTLAELSDLSFDAAKVSVQASPLQLDLYAQGFDWNGLGGVSVPQIGSVSVSDLSQVDADDVLSQLASNAHLTWQASFSDLVQQQFANIDLKTILSYLDLAVDKVLGLSKAANLNIPIINHDLGSQLHVAKQLADAVQSARSAGVTTLQDLKALLADSATLGDVLSFTVQNSSLLVNLNLNQVFHFNDQFSFSQDSALNVSGKAELYTQGQVNLSGGFTITYQDQNPQLPALSALLSQALDLKVALLVSGSHLDCSLGMDLFGKSVKQVLGVEDGWLAFAGVLQYNLGSSGDSLSGLLARNTQQNDVNSGFELGGNLPIEMKGLTLGDIALGQWNGSSTASRSLTDIKTTYKDWQGWIGGGARTLTPTLTPDQLKHLTVVTPTGTTPVTGNAVLDLSSIYTQLDQWSSISADLFDSLEVAVEGLDLLLDNLQRQLDRGFAQQLTQIPVLGPALDKGVDFLAQLNNDLVQPLREFVASVADPDAQSVALFLQRTLQHYLKPFNNTYSKALNWGSYAWNNNLQGIRYNETSTSAEWAFSLGDSYVLGSDLDLDLGFAGLGLETSGGVDLNLNWALNFGFGISASKGFYLILPAGDELSLSLSASVQGTLLGKMVGLGMLLDMDKGNLSAEASLGLDLNDIPPGPNSSGDQAQQKSNGEIAALSPHLQYLANVDLNAPLTLGVASTLGQDAPAFPTLATQLVMNWNKTWGDITTQPNLNKLGFSSVRLDLGEYVSRVLGPVVSQIQSVLSPLQPVLDFLTSPFPVLDDLGLSLTPVQLAQMCNPNIDAGMVYALADLLHLANQISSYSAGNVQVDLGEFFYVKNAEGREYINNEGKNFLAGNALSSLGSEIGVDDSMFGSVSDGALKSVMNAFNTGSITTDATALNAAIAGLTSKFDTSIQNGSAGFNAMHSAFTSSKSGGWTFLWDNPSDALGLLMGQDVTLVAYDMPALNLAFNYSQFIPVVGPIGARIGVELGAQVDLAFGYDTLGIRQWVASDYKNYKSLLNGFYVNDLDANGVDVDEFSLYGGLTAAAEINLGVASGGVGGGVYVDVGIDLYDPDHDGKVRLQEMKENIRNDGVMGLFDTHGEITAEFYAYVNYWIGSKRWSITKPITLATFDLNPDRDPLPYTPQEDNVVAAVGEYAANRLNGNTQDGDESISYQLNSQGITQSTLVVGGKTFTVGDGKELEVPVKDTLIIKAGQGNDTVTLTGTKIGFDVLIEGGEGNDTIDLSGLSFAAGHKAVIWGGAGDDTITGSQSADLIFGDSGDYRYKDGQFVYAEAVVDESIFGNDTLNGGAGNDIILGGFGQDLVQGSSGNDLLMGDGGRLRLTQGVATVDRTQTAYRGSQDTLLGGDGDDSLYAGLGDDLLGGGLGNDFLYGEKGNDQLIGDEGDDHLWGGDGMDLLIGDRVAQGLTYGALFPAGVFSAEWPYASTDSLPVTFETSSVAAITTYGTDTLYGGQGSDLLLGDGGSVEGVMDYLYGGLDNDLIDGDGGDDVIEGNSGNDVVYGGHGGDQIDGGAGDDILFGDGGQAGLPSGVAPAWSEQTFGTNIAKAFGLSYQSLSTSTETGNDTITVGPGSDFADGQAGRDTVFVGFDGGTQISVNNITDTGNDEEQDRVTVQGTSNEDHLLIRNSDNGLGMVALVPIQDETNAAPGDKIGLERVNLFPSAIEFLTVDAGSSNDHIYLDGTSSDLQVLGGSGSDHFYVGQLYQSSRDSSAQVASEDEFSTVGTTQGYLSAGVDEDTMACLSGGSGSDEFVVYHNEGSLFLTGDSGDDLFTVQGFVPLSGQTLRNGAFTLDGGAGNDSFLMRGSEASDTFVYTQEGVFSSFMSVAMSGVENSSVEAGAGDDNIYVLGTDASTVTRIEGGLGNDSFYNGGTGTEISNLFPASGLGKNEIITHSVVEQGDSDTSFSQAVVSSVGMTVVDTTGLSPSTGQLAALQAEPRILFVDSAGHQIQKPSLRLNEGTAATLRVGVSHLRSQDTHTQLTLSIPQFSDNATQQGDRGVCLLDSHGHLVSELTVDITSATSWVDVQVYAPADLLAEEDMLNFLLIEGSSDAGKFTQNSDPVTVRVCNTSNPSTTTRNLLLSRADRFGITSTSSNSFTLSGFPQDVVSSMTVYLENEQNLLTPADYTYANNVITLTESVFNRAKTLGSNLVVQYNTNVVELNGETGVDLAYASVSQLKVEFGYLNALSNLKVICTQTGSATNASDEYYYAEEDGHLNFYDKNTHRLVSLKGILKITGTAQMPTPLAPATPVTPMTSGDLVQVSYAASQTLIEGRTDLYGTYHVSLTQAPASGQKVYVQVGASAELSFSLDPTQGFSATPPVLEFTENNWSTGITVYVAGVGDAVEEDVSTLSIPAQPRDIKDLNGEIYEDGAGASSAAEMLEPLMLRYNHQTLEDGTLILDEQNEISLAHPVSLNGTTLVVNHADIVAMDVFKNLPVGTVLTPADLYHLTITMTDAQGVSQLRRIEEAVWNAAQSQWTLTLKTAFDQWDGADLSQLIFRVTPNRDALFVDENQSVDRFFVNNLDTTQAGTSTLQHDTTSSYGSEVTRPDQMLFQHTSIHNDGIHFENMELTEIDLGSGRDTVHVYGAASRLDGYQNVTVIRTGDESNEAASLNGDTVHVHSYRAEALSTLASAQISQVQTQADGTCSVTLAGNVVGTPEQLEAGIYLQIEQDSGSIRRLIQSWTYDANTQTTVLVVDRPVDTQVISLLGDLVYQPANGHWGDGLLAINTQSGNDVIDAYEQGLALVDQSLVLFGGLGADQIQVADQAVVFGDRGQVVYEDEDSGDVATLLGSTLSGSDYTTELDFSTSTSGGLTSAGQSTRQTDGVRREALLYQSMTPEQGGQDSITVYGENNYVFGGADSDHITIQGGDNIVFGDHGSLELSSLQPGVSVPWGDEVQSRVTLAQSTQDQQGAADQISVQGAGRNVLFGGTGNDLLTSAEGDDIIVGDGGEVHFAQDESWLNVSNAGRTVAGDDVIDAGTGENTILGGLGDDQISAGHSQNAQISDDRERYSNDRDVVLGDNGSRTFQGSGTYLDGQDSTTLSFNFKGAAQQGLASDSVVGASQYEASNWNNIQGSLSGVGPSSYGNDPAEIVRNSEGERMAGLVLSYGGSQGIPTANIELNAYSMENYQPDQVEDGWLYAGGVRTSAPNSQSDNKLEVEMDGLSKYFAHYDVVVYLDAPSNLSSLIENPEESTLSQQLGSSQGESIRKVSISEENQEKEAFYLDDAASSASTAYNTFNGTYIRSQWATAEEAFGHYANYVVFEDLSADRFVVTITDGVLNVNYNGRDLPSIAGIQIIGHYHAVDTIQSSQSEWGGDDTISTSGGDDVVIGGAGDDTMVTFGDIRDGMEDGDVVIGDNGLVQESLIPGAGSQISYAQSTGWLESLGSAPVTFNDVIVTGNGNDVVIGGEGQDQINTARQDSLANSLLQGLGVDTDLTSFEDSNLKVMSFNFSYSNNDPQKGDADLEVTSGQYAGVVAATHWNNLKLQPELNPEQNPHPYTNTQFVLNDGSVAQGINFTLKAEEAPLDDNTYSALQVDSSNGHDQIDPDSDNARLMESYYWAQQQQEIEIDIAGVQNQTGFGTYDVYVYMDGDRERTDSDNYVYSVSGGDYSNGNMQTYYVNDWKGATFNGEFKEVTATSYSSLNDRVVPNMEMVGNYVVFRNVTASTFSIRVRNVQIGSQSPMNQPSIAGVQIVGGSSRTLVATNGDQGHIAPHGDYDKDVVLGDNGEVALALDIPFGVNDQLDKAQNKVFHAQSFADSFLSGDQVLDSDHIETGRNQDTVLGGNGSDVVDSGAGADVVLGDNGQIEMVDYNPIGVRMPLTLQILDHQVNDDNTYIGKPGFSEGSFSPLTLAGVQLQDSAAGDQDLIDAGADNDLVYGQEGSDVVVLNEGTMDVAADSGSDIVKRRDSAYASSTEYLNDLTNVLALLDDQGDAAMQELVANDFGPTQSLGTLYTHSSGSGNPTLPSYDIGSGQELSLNLQAGDQVLLTATQWPGWDNPNWNPNIVLTLNGDGQVVPALSLEVTANGQTSTLSYGGGDWYKLLDLPDSGAYEIRLTVVNSGAFRIRLTNG